MGEDGIISQDLLDNIFGRIMSGRSIFHDRRILRSDYVPAKLPYRDRQITFVAEALAPVLKGSRPSNLLLYGKTGTGKTAVAKYVTAKISDKISSIGLRLNLAYCNTRMSGTEYRTLADIAAGVGLNIPFTGLATNEAFQRILDRLSSSGDSAVLILDEIDYLVKNFGDDLLYELTRASERLPTGFLTVVGISNDLRFKEFLDPRVLSSLSEEEIVFPPYTAEEIKGILQERIAEAFLDSVVSDAAVNLCSALAASEHGDARRAVDLLRVAGEVVEREGSQTVEEKHITQAVQRIEQDRIAGTLRSLPIHAKILIISTLANEQANTGKIYERYTAVCRKAGMEPLTQRRVSGILSELDLLGLLTANVVSQGRFGRSKRVATLVDHATVCEVFAEDPLTKGLL